MSDTRIGASKPRVEDFRFLTGTGRYIADINLPDQAYAFVIRSQHAAADINSIDKEAASTAPGVLGVFTAEDLGNDLSLTKITFKRQRPDGSPMFWRPQPALATGRVHYVGEPVVVVVANSLAEARDAAELVVVDYDPTDSVTGITPAMEPTSPRVWPECPDNISNIHEMGDRAKTDAAFAQAAHIIRRRYVVTRVHCQYMEPRGAIGAYDTLSGRYTLYCDVQSPHQVRDILANEVFRIPTDRVRVAAFDIGGAFGGKAQAVEHRLLLWTAKRIGRPVKWLEDRSESILADEHGRDNTHEAELALDAEGRFLALRSRWIANVGAFISNDRNFQTSFINAPGMTGIYRFPTAYVKSICVMTNTGPLAPYRGAGRPEATYVIERLIDDAARELGLDRVELRRKNALSPEELPIKTPLGFSYDCGEFIKCMDKALELADWGGYPERRRVSQSRGLLRGISVVNPIERAGPPLLDYAELRLDQSGHITLLVGTKNHGQGHETAFAQIIGSKLGLDINDITFVDGDTDRVAFGNGTVSSRSASIAGTAITMAADKIIKKGSAIAAHMMEAAVADIVFDDGLFSVTGTDKHVSLKEVAALAYRPQQLPKGIEAGLFESGTWAPEAPTFPYGTHICEVEIDPDTGTVRLDRYTVVDDVGAMINPLIVKGQIHGGIVQGAGQILLEQIAYDPQSGQCLTGSFMDYGMPRADGFCEFKIKEHKTLTARNPLGVKGVGEAGAVGAMPVVMNAILDALAPLGVDTLDMPATPPRIWEAVQRQRAV